ncbi:TsaC protein (YrdC domain) required for threonylcarbamoyladenosine t(6)A37 modification in tRNA [Moritella sp. JT01]|uniref:L-threonylcarbamoyladenylate synthase n=1 Tax=Moritella sp. JT01 TaxID=756698 RepID=UPI000797C68A|nr:L-threonylcarbamoyladenylate synthase [Moritella sp. JT01]KXO08165.1 TsaC protein (YrdC domain) required for threonylcarbamoyladenosine t(6)A37 modification in tRNA [Moritella sp. JT01]
MTINNRYIIVNNSTAINNAVTALQNQQVIAYPTEAVFGLGCDPMNEKAVQCLLTIKQRPVEKGLILIAANLAQLNDYVDLTALSTAQIDLINQTWPGPVTWVMPAKSQVPKWLTGQFDSIAVRVSAHPTVQALCLAFRGPITSTSANLTGLTPCVTAIEVTGQLGPLLGAIVDEAVGELAQPTTIRDAITGKIYR